MTLGAVRFVDELAGCLWRFEIMRGIPIAEERYNPAHMVGGDVKTAGARIHARPRPLRAAVHAQKQKPFSFCPGNEGASQGAFKLGLYVLAGRLGPFEQVIFSEFEFRETLRQ